MEIRRFSDHAVFLRAAVELFRAHLGARHKEPHAVILPGGSTPFGIYRELSGDPPETGPRLHVLLSDERQVPVSSPDSNYGRMQALFDALGLPEKRILHPDTALPPEQSAADYDHRISEFCELGGVITLGVLGLGADGHTASLFNDGDLRQAGNRLAIATQRPGGEQRISVTKNLISRANRIVFICMGSEKSDIVARLENDPGSVVAAKATDCVAQTEIWYSRQRG